MIRRSIVAVTLFFLFTPIVALAQWDTLKPIEIRLGLTGEESPYVITDMRFTYASGSDFSLKSYARVTPFQASCTGSRDAGRIWMEVRTHEDDCPADGEPTFGAIYDSLRGYRALQRVSFGSYCHAEFTLESDTNRDQVFYWFLWYPDGSIRYSEIKMKLQFDCDSGDGIVIGGSNG